MKWINEMISVIALLPTEAVILCHLYIINFAVLWPAPFSVYACSPASRYQRYGQRSLRESLPISS